MNTEDLLQAIGTADERMLEKTEKKLQKQKWTAILTAAACLCLVIFAIYSFTKSPAHKIYPEKITWNMGLGVAPYKDGGLAGGSVPYYYAPEYLFAYGMAIEAKVVEVFPDTYAIPGQLSDLQYHVLRLRVRDTIIGEDFPKEIFYLLPSIYDPNLMEYDFLILSLRQVGMENFLVLNTTQSQAETLDFVFMSNVDFSPYWGSVVAYKQGKVDPGLWDKEGWNRNKKYLMSMIERPNSPFPCRVERSLSETKRLIKEQSEEYKLDITVTKVCSQDTYRFCLGASSTFKYLEPFRNGTFKQSVDNFTFGAVSFQRVINGFVTNEYLMASWEERAVGRNVWSNVRFTDEDMENLPDMVSVIENLEEVLPPEYQTDENNTRFRGVIGTYYKVGDVIYGVVEAQWGFYYSGGIPNTCYILVYQDDTYEIVTREELDKIIG